MSAYVPRFVILHHVFPPGAPRANHWDFMLQTGGVLRTWALAAEPRDGIEIAAEALSDHRLAYLDYEGPLSGERGDVTQWDSGECELTTASEHELRCQLHGRRLLGTAVLSRSPAGGEIGQRWMFLFKNK